MWSRSLQTTAHLQFMFESHLYLVKNLNQTALLGMFSQVRLSTAGGGQDGGGGILSDGKTLMQSHTYEVPAEPVKPSQL